MFRILFSILTAITIGCASNSMRSDHKPMFRSIGHRGAAGYAPENTMAAFVEAKKISVKEVELDIQLTSDKKIILFHDSEMSKKTKMKGPISDYKLADLLKVDIGTWFDLQSSKSQKSTYAGEKLVTLDQVFTQFQKQFYYHVEIKSKDQELPELLSETLKSNQQLDNVTVTSFYFTSLQKMKAIQKTIPVCYLIDEQSDSAKEIQRAKDAGFEQVALHSRVIDANLVKLANGLGLEIRGYGVKTKEDLSRIQVSGAYGSTLDYPDWAM